MTMALAVTGEKSIWLVTDRRLTFGDGNYKDDAVKQSNLETPDGFALLGYAGLGLTAVGNEPSQWMSNTLRGHNLGLESMLSILAEAARDQLPKHLTMLGSAHAVIIPAFVNGVPTMYSIELEPVQGQADYSLVFRRTPDSFDQENSPTATRVIAIGSGSSYLPTDGAWKTELNTLIEEHESGKATPEQVVSWLAKLNNQIAAQDQFVSSRSIVTWKLHNGTGGVAYFTGTERERPCHGVPTVGNGMDISAIIKSLVPHAQQALKALLEGKPDTTNADAINNDISKIPCHPDDKLE